MESMSFEWLNNDTDIIDSLVQLASLPNQPISPNSAAHMNVGDDVLQYLNQQNSAQKHDMNTASVHSFGVQGDYISHPTHNLLPQQQEMSSEQVNQVIESLGKIDPVATGGVPPQLSEAEVSAVFQQPISIVQGKDNFVTFTPALNISGDGTTSIINANSPRNTKNKQNSKKVKYREPIFVTESPQSFNKKMKKYPTNSNNHSSSAEENSEDEDDVLLQNTSSASLKQMSSKERRQLRNKISARNFRVRRKEYITKLEEKVEQQEKIIQSLREENAKLKKANQEVTNQVIDQLITPPPSGDEFQSSSPSSSSESHGSPHAPASIPQFQFNDLYSFDLFDQQPVPPLLETNNAFYLNHAVMPDWDMHRVLNDKMVAETTEEHQRELVRDLFTNYPLLAPALMSIVVRHTLSLEYVANLMREFTESIENDNATVYGRSEDEETLRGHDDLDDLKASMNAMNLNDSRPKEEKQTQEQKPDELDDQAHLELMLKNSFTRYALHRARGLSHQQAFERYKQCMQTHPDCLEKIKQRTQKAKEAKQAKEANSKKTKKCSTSASGIQTLQAYCRVAGTLLRQPQRMTHMSQVLKDKIEFKNKKHMSLIERNFKKAISPAGPQNLRIANC